MESAALLLAMNDNIPAMPVLVARSDVLLGAIKDLVAQIVRERNPQGLDTIRFMRRQLTEESAALDKLLADFRAGIDRISVSDPLARRLIEVRAMLTMVGIEQMIASLQLRPAAVAAAGESSEGRG
jgi:hypothetical protein